MEFLGVSQHLCGERERNMESQRKAIVVALQFACSDSIFQNVDTAERVQISFSFRNYLKGITFVKPYKGQPTISRMQNLAKELGVAIPVSLFEEANNAHYNSVAIIDADGTDLGLYRKSQKPDGPEYQEEYYFNPGNTGCKVFAAKFAKIGIAICWDQ